MRGAEEGFFFFRRKPCDQNIEARNFFGRNLDFSGVEW